VVIESGLEPGEVIVLADPTRSPQEQQPAADDRGPSKPGEGR